VLKWNLVKDHHLVQLIRIPLHLVKIKWFTLFPKTIYFSNKYNNHLSLLQRYKLKRNSLKKKKTKQRKKKKLSIVPSLSLFSKVLFHQMFTSIILHNRLKFTKYLVFSKPHIQLNVILINVSFDKLTALRNLRVIIFDLKTKRKRFSFNTTSKEGITIRYAFIVKLIKIQVLLSTIGA
jgi:hypothetical protein